MTHLPYRQVHLDFHTPTLPFQLGKNFDKYQFQQTLIDAHVDSITLTGRCHHGHIYYDTALPAKHPQMKNDFLMELVDACHEINVNAPIYLTVGWDAFSADHHPEWLERKSDGTLYGFEDFGQLLPGWKTLCFNTPYLDYLKQQIQDTMHHFGAKLDGLFFDIVWQDPCCCNYCVEKMLDQGYDPADENDQKQFAKLTEQFLKDEIYQTVYAIQPNCEVFFNEGNILPSIRKNLSQYTHLEIESLPSGQWGYQHFPTVVRYAKNLGKEYVGMTGKFHKVWADFGSYKNQAALEYESFLALAHGAKCSIGDQMYPDGTLQPATYDLIGSVYQQVEQLESYNQNTHAVTEIAIVHPGIVEECAEKVDLALAGAVNILNEAHYQFDIVDHFMDWQKYRVLILPDKIRLNNILIKKITEYIDQGGKILASYKSGLKQDSLAENSYFIKSWGLDYQSENQFNPTYGVYNEQINATLPNGELVLHGPSLVVTTREAKILGEEITPLYQRNYLHYYSHFQAPAAAASGYPVITKSDSVCYFSHSIFTMYKESGMKPYKELVLATLKLLMDDKKIITTSLPTTADVILNHQSERQQLILNLLHYIPQRTSIELDTIEDVIPLYNFSVTLDLTEISNSIGQSKLIEIEKVCDIKEQKNLIFNKKDNQITIQVPKLEGYQLIVIDYV